MPPRPPRSNKTEKKSPLGKLIVAVIVLAVLGAAGLIASHLPATMDLERRMDSAASAITPENILMLAEAIETYPRAANREEAKQLLNEMIRVSIDESVAATDYRRLEAISKELKDQPALKPYAAGENGEKLAAAWAETLKRMEAEQRQLNEFRDVAGRIVNAASPNPLDVSFALDFKLPPGFADAGELRTGAVYAAAVALKVNELADSILAKAEDKDTVRAGTEEPCRECGASGKTACRNCTKAPGKCPSCGGTGSVMTNQLVNGKFERVQQPCLRCEATGKCVVCKGEGKHDCFFCKGSGKRVNSELAAKTMKEKFRQLIDGINRQETELKRLKAEADR